MASLSASRVSSLFFWLALLSLGRVFAQDPASDSLLNNGQLWKSLQQEIKTLEQTAHKVNTLLLSNANQLKTEDNRDTKPVESAVEVTVLSNPDAQKNAFATKTEESKVEENEKDSENPHLLRETGKPITWQNFKLSPFSFGSFNNIPEPWRTGKNVCVEKSEKEEERDASKQKIGRGYLILGSGTFEHCKQTPGKYICTTVLSTMQSTKTVTMTYQCCEGFHREASSCVSGDDDRAVHSEVNNNSNDEKSKSEYDPSKNVASRLHYNSVNIGKSTEDKSYSSQSDEEETLEQWRKFNWARL